MARREGHAHDGWGGEVLIGSRLFLSGLLFSGLLLSRLLLSRLLFSRLLFNGLLFHRLLFNGSTLALLRLVELQAISGNITLLLVVLAPDPAVRNIQDGDGGTLRYGQFSFRGSFVGFEDLGAK